MYFYWFICLLLHGMPKIYRVYDVVQFYAWRQPVVKKYVVTIFPTNLWWIQIYTPDFVYLLWVFKESKASANGLKYVLNSLIKCLVIQENGESRSSVSVEIFDGIWQLFRLYVNSFIILFP